MKQGKGEHPMMRQRWIQSFSIIAVCLGVALVMPAKAADHVVIMAISNYVSAPLAGVRHDPQNALQLAEKLGYETTGATILRDKHTPPSLFRQQTYRLATLLAFAATSDLPLRTKRIETPITAMDGAELAPKIALVPILRAGLGMVEPLQQLLPRGGG